MTNTKAYGWQQDGKWCLSLFPKPKDDEKKRPVNEYATQQEAITEAANRGLKIEWL